MSSTANTGIEETFLASIERIGDDVAAKWVDEVDRDARFPHEAIDALRESQALSALVPRELGGGGASIDEIASACFTLGKRCGATAMVFAMHQIQVACIVRHRNGSDWFEQYLRDLVTGQRLIASATSEVGTGGDMGRSVAAVEVTRRRDLLVREAGADRELRQPGRRSADDLAAGAGRGRR